MSIKEIKFTKEDIQNTLVEIQDATRNQDYNKVKEIMKNYGLSASVEDIDSLRKLAEILDTEISKEKLLQMKADKDFEKFKEIMRLHKLYLEHDPLGVRAEISCLDLRGRVLTGFDFYGVQIRYTDFSGCSLQGVNFGNAYLYGVNFTRANLEHVNFSLAILYEVNFTKATLSYANFPKYLNCGYSHNEKIESSFKRRKGMCLNKPIIGWKKCYYANGYQEVLVKLEIPRGAVVFSINDDKCRTNMAKVLDIVSLDGKKHYKLAYASYRCFKYRVGKEIFEPKFNCQYNIECAEGIHFFRNKRRAIEY